MSMVNPLVEVIIKLRIQLKSLQAENTKLKNTMELHAGDCCSLNNEVEMFRGRWEDAEERCNDLQKMIRDIEDWATINFNESLLKFIRLLKEK